MGYETCGSGTGSGCCTRWSNQKIEYMAWQAGDFHEYGFAAENSIVGSSKDLKEGIGKLKEEN